MVYGESLAHFRIKDHGKNRGLGRSRQCLMALVWLAWSIGGCVAFAQSQPQEASEYTVKAAFVFNFTRYIKWPSTAFESADSPFVIGVLGDVPPELAKSLEYYQQNKQAQDRIIDVRYLSKAEEATNCQIVFVRNTLETDRVAEIVKLCSGQPILLVGESDSFLQQGGGISLLTSGQRVSFRLALKSTARQELRPDAKLLRVAELVD